MSTLRSINQSLTAAAAILDHAANEMRDRDIESRSKHIEGIGRALAEIFAIQHAIFEIQPGLKPDWLSEQPTSPDNRALTETMGNVIELEQCGNVSSAISELERFLSSATSGLHRGIAENEIRRLRAERET